MQEKPFVAQQTDAVSALPCLSVRSCYKNEAEWIALNIVFDHELKLKHTTVWKSRHIASRQFYGPGN